MHILYLSGLSGVDRAKVIDQETEALRAHTGIRDRPLGLGGGLEPFNTGGFPPPKPRQSASPPELRAL